MTIPTFSDSEIAVLQLVSPKPIIPGLMPVTNFKQIQRIATLCKARLPTVSHKHFEKAGDDVDAQFEAGVDYASKQAEELISEWYTWHALICSQ